MSKKFIEEAIIIEGEKWQEMQKLALDFLQSQGHQKITQHEILFYSFRKFVNDEISRLFRGFATDDTRIYFAPMIVEENATLEKAEAILKFYFVDELEKYNWDQKVDVPFNHDIENDPTISNFITNFLKSYDFRIETSQPISDHMFVRISKIDKKTNQKQYMNFETNDKRFELLTQQVLGMVLGETKEISQDGELIEVTVEKLWEYKKMPITDQNARLLNIPEIKDLESTKKYIKDAVTEQMFLKLLVDYKNNVVDELISKLPKLELSEDFIAAEAEKQEQILLEKLYKTVPNMGDGAPLEKDNPEIKTYARMNAERELQLSFYDSLLAKSLKISIKDEEILKEERAIFSFVPPSERSNQYINIPNIVSILTARKIGLYFLEKNHLETYNKYAKKYT